MKYGVYQIHMTNDEIDEVNSMENPRENHPKFRAKTCAMFEEWDDAKGFYNKVAEIEANDLEHVFHIGNMGPEDAITRLDRMHSVSVGDIIVDESGAQWGVESFGFTQLEDMV